MKRISLTITVILLIACSQAHGQISFDEGDIKFKTANQFYKEGKYLEAIKAYEEIVDDGGLESGAIYYNLGNSYFRLRNLGKTILNYEHQII